MAKIVDMHSKRPFYLFAERYLEGGWYPLPLPPNKKAPVPKGYTGRHDPPTAEQVKEWLDERPQSANIAIRVPDGLIGIDVDAYPGKVGAATFAGLVERLGAFPPCWVLTSRSDGISGIRFFRTPTGLHWPGQLGTDVQIIQFRHRYAVAYPSAHPDTGQAYRWYPPDAKLNGKDWYPGVPSLQDVMEARLPETRNAKA